MENRLILCKYVPVHTAEQIRVHLNTPLPSPESLCHLDIAIVPAGAILLSLSECLEHASSLRNLVRLAAHRGHSGDGLQANKVAVAPLFQKDNPETGMWHGMALISATYRDNLWTVRRTGLFGLASRSPKLVAPSSWTACLPDQRHCGSPVVTIAKTKMKSGNTH